MVGRELFSKREDFEEPVTLLPYDVLPNAARLDFIEEFTYRIFPRVGPYSDGEALANRYSELIADIYDDMRSIIWELDGKEPEFIHYQDQLEHIIDTLKDCSWVKFYNVCEVLYPYVNNRDLFIRGINERFRFHRLAWRYNNQGQIVRVRPEHVNTAVTIAWKRLSSKERFTTAFDQFIKAIGFMEQRPNPDYPNAVKDAVGATEAVANIIESTTDLTLSELMKRQRFSTVHGAIREIIGKLYAYRGDAEGAAHGAVGKPPVGEEEANLVVTIASGVIAYLIAKFSEDPAPN